MWICFTIKCLPLNPLHCVLLHFHPAYRVFLSILQSSLFLDLSSSSFPSLQLASLHYPLNFRQSIGRKANSE